MARLGWKAYNGFINEQGESIISQGWDAKRDYLRELLNFRRQRDREGFTSYKLRFKYIQECYSKQDRGRFESVSKSVSMIIRNIKNSIDNGKQKNSISKFSRRQRQRGSKRVKDLLEPKGHLHLLQPNEELIQFKNALI